MKTAADVDKKELREMIGLLNQLAGVLPAKIKVVGVTHAELYKLFVDTIRLLPQEIDERAAGFRFGANGELDKGQPVENAFTDEEKAKWDKVINFYNPIVEPDGEEDGEDSGEEKPEKPKKERKAKGEKKEKIIGPPKNIGVGALVRSLLVDDEWKSKPNAEIAAEVVRQLGSNTTAQNIGWYKNKAKKSA
jgi:hypothetical protein